MTISRMQEPRQLYGLGSFVKKITKPIKKIVKSPIGKAALGAAALYGVNRFGIPGTSGFGQGAISRFLSGRVTNPAGPGSTGGLGNIISRVLGKAKTGFGGLSGGQQAFLGAGAAASLLPFLMGGEEEEEEILEDPFSVTPTNISDIVAQARDRDPSLRFLPKTSVAQSGFFNAAEGGRAQLAGGGNRVTQLLQLLEGTKDPMDRRMIQQEIDMLLGKFAKGGIARLGYAGGMNFSKAIRREYAANVKEGYKGSIEDYITDFYGEEFLNLGMKEGGIADLPAVRMLEGGVPEIDYRQSGGFVPVGKKEKADDVPAMLSKNEFVMTADAVRGMGEGNVEKGAQKMYDQMKQLENRVV